MNYLKLALWVWEKTIICISDLSVPKKKKKVLEERFHFAHDCVFVKVLFSEQMFKAPKAAITFCEYIYCLNHTELLLMVVG